MLDEVAEHKFVAGDGEQRGAPAGVVEHTTFTELIGEPFGASRPAAGGRCAHGDAPVVDALGTDPWARRSAKMPVSGTPVSTPSATSPGTCRWS